MQNEKQLSVSSEEKAPEITKEQKTRHGVRVFLFFLTILFLILPIVTRVRVREDKTYDTKNYVALYLFTYHHLPSNYVKKTDPSISNSGVQPSDGRYIGGDVFYYSGEIRNYTDKTDLRECDLSYDENTTTRGTKRLVYSADCTEIFYTETHYGDNGDPAFVRVTVFGIQKTSNILLIVFVVLILVDGVVEFTFARKDRGLTGNLKTTVVLFLKAMVYVLLIPLYLICFLVYSAIQGVFHPEQND